MKDLFDKALIALPAFMSDVLELLSGPKAFILRKDLATDEAAQEAYTFLGVTLLIALIAQVTFLPEQKDYFLTFTSIAVQGVLNLVLMVAVLFFAWKIVGGTLSFRIFFIATCFLSGISTLILAYFTLLASGFLKLFDPAHATQVLHGAPPPDPPTVGSLGYLLILGAGFVAVYVWILVVWGAYRRLNNVSRTRSAIALTVYTIVSPLLLAFVVVMQGNYVPAQDRREPSASPLPLEIVGLWKVNDVNAPDGPAPPESTIVDFSANGEYFRIHRTSVRQGACVITALENSRGRASVDGPMITLSPRTRTATAISSCSTEKLEKALDLDKETYSFEIRREATGWLLCLGNRYGQQCLTARAN